MVIREYYKTRNDGVKLYRIYSSDGLMLKQIETDTIYDEAIDVENAPYVYVETENDIESVNDIKEETQ